MSGTTFCAGDPLSVTFTATGTWGHKNAFTLQLSNDSGIFDNGFQNIGSIVDTAPGTFTIYTTAPGGLTFQQFSITQYIDKDGRDTLYYADTVMTRIIGNDTTFDTVDAPHIVVIPDTVYDTTLPTHYRVRIMGALPYTLSADNGTDIVVSPSPGIISFSYPRPGLPTPLTDSLYDAVIGAPINYYLNGGSGTTFYWNYGDGADPATFTEVNSQQPKTTYSTPGLKMVTVQAVASGGCSVSDTAYTYVYDCTIPVIPNDAIVISSDTALGDWDDSSLYYAYSAIRNRTFWINPGVTVWTNTGVFNNVDTIFAESGANILGGGSQSIVYLKPGATASDCLVISDTGTSLTECTVLECPGLSFDYSQAPPNAIMAAYESVAPAVSSEPIELFPNPTNGNVTLQNLPLGANIMVMNVLGETVQTENARGNTNLSLDLSNFAPGTYYIRIASGNSVTTKKMVKE